MNAFTAFAGPDTLTGRLPLRSFATDRAEAEPIAIFHCPTADRFAAQADAIAAHVSTHGYAVVEAWDAETATLSEVAARFGRVQSHIRADANGLVGISVDTVVNREWEAFRSEYRGVSTEEFLPHTDGSYLQGLVREGDHYLQLLPPGMLLLQCWQPASSGGGNILVDGQRVFHDLARAHPRHHAALSTKGCVTYCRDDQIALDCAVFERLRDGTAMLRFRYDAAAFVADWAIEAFHLLQNEYFANPAYQIRLALGTGQIALVDNHRMLHGRDAFVNEQPGKGRSMRRVWLSREGLPVLRNAAGQTPEKRALKRCEAYRILKATAALTATPSLGIRPAA